MVTWLCFHYFMVILRSTKGPYRRPIVEVAYGKILFSLYRGCMEGDSSGRVVGVSTCCRPCWTYLGQHQCGLNAYYFLSFHTAKLYVLCFQIYIYSIKQNNKKKNTGGLWPCLGPTRFRECFWPPIGFTNKINTTDRISRVLKIVTTCYFIMTFKFNLLVFRLWHII